MSRLRKKKNLIRLNKIKREANRDLNFDGYKEEEGNGIGVTLGRVGKTLTCVFTTEGPSEGLVYFNIYVFIFGCPGS